MSEQQTPLIKRLTELAAANDLAAFAILRRSLSFEPGAWPAAFPYVEPTAHLGDGWRRMAAYLVAGLYALSRVLPRNGTGFTAIYCNGIIQINTFNSAGRERFTPRSTATLIPARKHRCSYMPQKIEFHIIQSFAPSNLNRDDTGSP